MKNKIIFSVIVLIVLVLSVVLIIPSKKEKTKEIDTITLEATVLNLENGLITVKSNDNVIYTFKEESVNLTIGDSIILEYAGLLDKRKSIQDGEVISYKVKESKPNNNLPSAYNDDGIFSTYYILAYDKLKTLTLDEKIGQLLLVRYPDSNQIETLKKYNFGGYVFFEKDFKNKTRDEVIDMIKTLQDNSKVPLLTSVDEEGGSVVRVSSNPNLANKKFESPSELYEKGGLNLIKQDVKEKSELLKNLGINVNLAPVVDVTTSPSDYMYNRSLKQNTLITSEFASAVISASKNTGVSYVLKHFPGYGNNVDTHVGTSKDTRTLESIMQNDIPPFKSGIESKAEAILVSHNIVNSIDPLNPASLSLDVHKLLRNDLGFTGVIITDDLDMGASKNIANKALKALQAGNNLIITTDFEESFNEIKTGLDNGEITEEDINKLVFKVIAWKYYKGLMIENDK